MTIARIYAAGKVRRWHANPVLADTAQTNADHQGACVQLLLMLHPSPSVALIKAVAMHDVGERWVGDVPYPFKAAEPVAAAAHARVESDARRRVHGRDPLDDITAEDAAWLSLVDRLESICHVAITRPGELAHDGWDRAIAAVGKVANDLGVVEPVGRLIADMRSRRF